MKLKFRSNFDTTTHNLMHMSSNQALSPTFPLERRNTNPDVVIDVPSSPQLGMMVDSSNTNMTTAGNSGNNLNMTSSPNTLASLPKDMWLGSGNNRTKNVSAHTNLARGTTTGAESNSPQYHRSPVESAPAFGSAEKQLRQNSSKQGGPKSLYHYPSFGTPEILHESSSMPSGHLVQVTEEDANTLTSKEEDFSEDSSPVSGTFQATVQKRGSGKQKTTPGKEKI